MVDLKIIDGKAVTEAEAAVQETNVVLLNDDATRVQLMVARLLKAIGKKAKTRVVLSSLAVIAGKVFTIIPQEQHGPALSEFVNLVAMAIRNEYTPEEVEKARQMALAAQRLREEQNAEASEPAKD